MVTDIATKTFTNRGTSAPLVANVMKPAPMATVMTKFATTVAKSKCQEVAMTCTWSAHNSARAIQSAKHSHLEIQTFLEMVHSPACSWMKSTVRDQVKKYLRLKFNLDLTPISP